MSSSLELLVFTFGFRTFLFRSVQVCSSFNPDLDRSGPELGRSGATSKLERNWPDLGENWSPNAGNAKFLEHKLTDCLTHHLSYSVVKVIRNSHLS